jgi:Domain of unknown function (DUF4288)
MNKYIAKVVYQILVSQNQASEQYDERLFLIEANDDQEAFFKARVLGVKNEDELVSHESGEGIFWKFVDVPFLNRLDILQDSTELYSCISERDREDQYHKYVKARASAIQSQFQPHAISH